MSRKKPQRINQYKIDNENYLLEKAKEEGITVLDNGVLMKRLEEGRGTVCPKPGSLVYVHYTGRLIDGTVFDSTDGDHLPAKWAYGSQKLSDIPAWSTLVFELELVKIANL